MSIRMRFALLYTAILAITLTFFGATLYTIQSQGTLTASKSVVSEFARRVAEGRRFQLAGEHWLEDPPPDRLPLLQRGESMDLPDRPDIRQSFREQGLYVQVRHSDGVIVFQSGSLNDMELPLSPAASLAVREGRSWVEDVTIQDEHVLVHSEPSLPPDGELEIVQVAVSLGERDQTLNALLRNLTVAGAIVILVALVIGWLFAGYVLRPIDRIRRTAQMIGEEQDFDRRVEFQGPNDELAQLASTFNTMLAQLQVAYRRIERALQMQRRFVADVSHELRTPLTTIRGNIELLRRVPPIKREDESAVVRDIVDETERLIRLVNDLLMLEHSDAGQRLRSEPIPIGPLVKDICHQASLLDPQRRISCSEMDGVVACGDPDALRQVLLILLDNAITHTHGDIDVAASVDGDQVAISIRDYGPGIPPERLSHIFERFYRGDEARSKPGTGLGLAIAKGLIEGQGGTIRVDSVADQGTAFTVSLPRSGAMTSDE
jgi:two-component system, OmpR family, sensor kinase